MLENVNRLANTQQETLAVHGTLNHFLGPSGPALSVGTELIENPSDLRAATEDERNQDCELTALSRLAPRLKRDFPQTPICLVGENLFACGRAIQIAHILLQLLEKGSLLPRLTHAVGKTAVELFGSLKRMASRLLECSRYYCLPDGAYAEATATRLDTSQPVVLWAARPFPSRFPTQLHLPSLCSKSASSLAFVSPLPAPAH